MHAIKRHSLNIIQRMYNRIDDDITYVHTHGSQEQKARVSYLLEKFDVLRKSHSTLSIIRVICFILFYFSAVSALLGNLLQEVVYVAAIVSGVIGSTTLLLVITLLTRLIFIKQTEAQMVASNIISIAEHVKNKNEFD